LVVRVFIAILAALAVAAAAGATVKPRVWLTDESPVIVGGTGFVPGEHVTVTVSASQLTLRKTVDAKPTGRLYARWLTASITDHCHMIRVTAVGSEGTRAVFRELPNPCDSSVPITP
jgi:hypothetical protein